jgi:hypothetical protein
VYVARKLLASAVVVAATVGIPTALGAVHAAGPTLHVSYGFVATRGWETPGGADTLIMRIGVPVAETLTIVNTGTLPADYRLSSTVRGDRRMLARLWLTVQRRSDGSIMFSGWAGRLRALSLGRFETWRKETLDVRATLVSAGSDALDNRFQGRSASIGFRWSATETT